MNIYCSMSDVSQASILTKNILKNSPGKCKKSGCSLCKSEYPLHKNIPSEKKLPLVMSIFYLFYLALISNYIWRQPHSYVCILHWPLLTSPTAVLRDEI